MSDTYKPTPRYTIEVIPCHPGMDMPTTYRIWNLEQSSIELVTYSHTKAHATAARLNATKEQ